MCLNLSDSAESDDTISNNNFCLSNFCLILQRFWCRWSLSTDFFSAYLSGRAIHVWLWRDFDFHEEQLSAENRLAIRRIQTGLLCSANIFIGELFAPSLRPHQKIWSQILLKIFWSELTSTSASRCFIQFVQFFNFVFMYQSRSSGFFALFNQFKKGTFENFKQQAFYRYFKHKNWSSSGFKKMISKFFGLIEGSQYKKLSNFCRDEKLVHICQN